MKKKWEAPVLETLGLEMTEQVLSGQDTEVVFTDTDSALLGKFGSGATEDSVKDKI